MMPPREDLEQLVERARLCSAALAELPPRPRRNAREQRDADAALANCRTVRQGFMRRHGPWVYDQATDGGRTRLRLDALATRAAARVPGLLPDPAQWAGEAACLQGDKEGWEQDLGVFFWGVLRDATCGEHLIHSMLMPTPAALSRLDAFQADGSAHVGPVHIERRGSTAYLTVTNPAGLNAEDNALAVALETAVDLTLLDPRVRVGVVRGGVMSHPKYAGRRVFCSGINLDELYHGKISFVGFFLTREFGYLNKIRRGLSSDADASSDGGRDKPWVAAVDAFAIGGGMQTVLAFDHVVAERSAYFALPAAKEGIIPGSGNLRLGLRAGTRVARDMILRGRKLDAAEAAAAGFVDEVVEPSAMGEAIAAAAHSLSSDAIAPNRRMLNLVEEPLDLFRRYMAEFALLQAQRIYAPDVMARLRGRWAS